MAKRQRLLEISPESIIACLRGEAILETQLPTDTSVAGFSIDPFTQSVLIRVVSEEFDEVPEYALPVVMRALGRKVLSVA